MNKNSYNTIKNSMVYNKINYKQLPTSNRIINKKNPFLMVIYCLIVLLGLVLVYIIIAAVYYSLTDCYVKKDFWTYLTSFSLSEPCKYKYKPASYKERKVENEKEVFHINNQNYSYHQAKCKCNAYNAKLATKNQVIRAYNQGAHWCNYGWTEGQQAFYPVQKCEWNKLNKYDKNHRGDHHPPNKHSKCGKPGMNGGYFANPELKFGANCFGVRPKGSVAIPKKPKCNRPPFCQRKYNHRAATKLDSDEISPFNKKQWSQYIS